MAFDSRPVNATFACCAQESVPAPRSEPGRALGCLLCFVVMCKVLCCHCFWCSRCVLCTQTPFNTLTHTPLNTDTHVHTHITTTTQQHTTPTTNTHINTQHQQAVTSTLVRYAPQSCGGVSFVTVQIRRKKQKWANTEGDHT